MNSDQWYQVELMSECQQWLSKKEWYLAWKKYLSMDYQDRRLISEKDVEKMEEAARKRGKVMTENGKCIGKAGFRCRNCGKTSPVKSKGYCCCVRGNADYFDEPVIVIPEAELQGLFENHYPTGKDESYDKGMSDCLNMFWDALFPQDSEVKE